MARAILIAYFTWSGNTRAVAQLIHREVGGTLFEIQPEVSYPTSYNAVLKQAGRMRSFLSVHPTGGAP
ncbi:MAG: flavodoxin [Candidatus Caldatribacteriaceae bacterium]